MGKGNQSSGNWCMTKTRTRKVFHNIEHRANTPQRPDIVLYSNTLIMVYLIELTCGDENNFESQRARYQQLLADVCATWWKAQLFTVEVGCQGLYHHTVPHLLNFFNIPRHRKMKVLNEVEMIALRCSDPTLFSCRMTTGSGLVTTSS